MLLHLFGDKVWFKAEVSNLHITSWQKLLQLASYFRDSEWVTKLANYHIFFLPNKLNLSHKERKRTAFKSVNEVDAFKVKLESWWRWVNIGIFYMFQTLVEILKEIKLGPSFSQPVHGLLSQLLKEFDYHSQKTKHFWTGNEWIWESFVTKPVESPFIMLDEDQILEHPIMVTLKVHLKHFKTLCILD